MRGQTIWGRLKVFSSGIEIVYDHPYVDHRGRKKTSFMIYGPELDGQMLSMLRYHDELPEAAREKRLRQVHRTFNPGPFKRVWRRGAELRQHAARRVQRGNWPVVGQYQKLNPPARALDRWHVGDADRADAAGKIRQRV